MHRSRFLARNQRNAVRFIKSSRIGLKDYSRSPPTRNGNNRSPTAASSNCIANRSLAARDIYVKHFRIVQQFHHLGRALGWLIQIQ